MTSEIWTEKYRPNTYDKMVGQEPIIKRVKALTDGMNIPHLMFAGPAGTGKSTLIHHETKFKKIKKKDQK